MDKIIARNRSIIPACDVPLDLYEQIVKETADIDEIGGYKIGFFLGLTYGLPKVVEITRNYSDKPIIYDHQKAGTDIPDTGVKFAQACKNAGINAVILFPHAGPETEKAWIKACRAEDIGVIVGGLMSHKCYLRSEGGYLDDDAIIEIYLNAADLGVSEFVVPGNRPDDIKKIRMVLEKRVVTPIFYSPGFITQGGNIAAALKAGGDNWHSIIGRGIYQAKDIKKAAMEYAGLI